MVSEQYLPPEQAREMSASQSMLEAWVQREELEYTVPRKPPFPLGSASKQFRVLGPIFLHGSSALYGGPRTRQKRPSYATGT